MFSFLFPVQPHFAGQCKKVIQKLSRQIEVEQQSCEAKKAMLQKIRRELLQRCFKEVTA
jgi:hypothetical protein